MLAISAAVLFGVLTESAERTLFFSILAFKLLIDLHQSFLVVTFQAVNLLVAQLHYHAENMGCLRAEFIPLGALHRFRISPAVIGREAVGGVLFGDACEATWLPAPRRIMTR